MHSASHRIRLATLAATALLASGCFPTSQWVREGASERDFERERSECLAEFGGNQEMMNFRRSRALNRCLRGRGWILADSDEASAELAPEDVEEGFDLRATAVPLDPPVASGASATPSAGATPPADQSFGFERCFELCRAITDRSKNECFDVCLAVEKD